MCLARYLVRHKNITKFITPANVVTHTPNIFTHSIPEWEFVTVALGDCILVTIAVIAICKGRSNGSQSWHLLHQ